MHPPQNKPQPPQVLVAQLNERDDDCACPDAPFLRDATVPSAARFIQTPDTHLAELMPGFHIAFSPLAPAGPSVLNRPALDRWQQFCLAQSLAEPVDEILAKQQLIQPIDVKQSPRLGATETLTAWLHVSNSCNLDCPYCYVRKSTAHMTDEVGLDAINRIFHTATSHGFQRVKLKYAGGEAMLHFRLVQRLHAQAWALAEATGLALREVLLTNGTRITAAEADWIAAAGLKLMVSLDGIGEVHDRLRPNRGGGGSFAAVERTVDEILLPRGIHPDITVTITRLNAAGAADAVRWALERDLPASLNFYRQNGQSASREDLALEESVIIDGLRAAYSVFENVLPVRPFFNGLLDRVQGEAHTHTCGVGLAYLVITHEGRLAQCQMHLDQPLPMTQGDDLLPLVAAGAIHNLSVDDKAGCRDCTYRYRCTGGCPIETYRATGKWNVQSPNCHIYKSLLPEALRLEGLRLLKVHGYPT